MDCFNIEAPLQLEECIICYEETTKFKFFPCKHKVCLTCFPRLHQCPLCQIVLRVSEPEHNYETCKVCFSIVVMMLFCVWALNITRII